MDKQQKLIFTRILTKLHKLSSKDLAEMLALQIEFWKAVCKQYEVPFIWPLSLETRRALVMKLIEAHDPGAAKWKVSTIQKMEGEILLGQLQALVDKHVLSQCNNKTKIQGNTKKRTREQELRAFALLELKKKDAKDKYQWGATPAAKDILNKNPDLCPISQQHTLDKINTQVQSFLSEHRTECAKVEELEQERKVNLRTRWDAIMSQCDAETQEDIKKVCESAPGKRPESADDVKVWLANLDEWERHAASVLPKSIFGALISLVLPVREAQIIVGLDLQRKFISSQADS